MPIAGLAELGGVENALTPAAALVVTGDLRPGVEDAHHASGHLDADLGADQPPGHAVVVGVEIDRAVRLHPVDHLAHLPERRPISDASASASYRRNRSIGGSPVVPWMR